MEHFSVAAATQQQLSQPEGFQGDAQLDILSASPEVIVSRAFFAPDSRTHWHTHEHGQLLQVTAGHGLVVSRSGEVAFATAGDSIWCPAGEEHWHGSLPTSFFSHVAFTFGTTKWGPSVTADEVSAILHHRTD